MCQLLLIFPHSMGETARSSSPTIFAIRKLMPLSSTQGLDLPEDRAHSNSFSVVLHGVIEVCIFSPHLRPVSYRSPDGGSSVSSLLLIKHADTEGRRRPSKLFVVVTGIQNVPFFRTIVDNLRSLRAIKQSSAVTTCKCAALPNPHLSFQSLGTGAKGPGIIILRLTEWLRQPTQIGNNYTQPSPVQLTHI